MHARSAALLLIFLIALVSFAQRPTTTRAEGTADNVQDIDLAKMVLPLSAFGPDYATFQTGVGFGFIGLHDESGAINGYELPFYNPEYNPRENAPSVPVLVTSVAVLFGSPDQASNYIASALANPPSGFGTFTTFTVPDLTDATGISITNPDRGFAESGVVFRHGRLVGFTVLFRQDNVDDQATAISTATALDTRMKGVLTGKITDFPAPLPPDVNCNGAVDSIDASLELQLGAGLVSSLTCGALGDANQDGSINAIDASLILQYSAGLIDQLPV